MNSRLYVGNISKETTEADLQTLFTEIGAVTSVTIPTDRKTGANKNFGFVQMETAESAQAAIKGISGRILNEHELRVSEARERE